MGFWQIQEAKARFSEFLNATLKKGPQVVTRRGVETAVLVPIGEWSRLQKAARPGLKVMLLVREARVENLATTERNPEGNPDRGTDRKPERRKMQRWPVPEFE